MSSFMRSMCHTCLLNFVSRPFRSWIPMGGAHISQCAAAQDHPRGSGPCRRRVLCSVDPLSGYTVCGDYVHMLNVIVAVNMFDVVMSLVHHLAALGSNSQAVHAGYPPSAVATLERSSRRSRPPSAPYRSSSCTSHLEHVRLHAVSLRVSQLSWSPAHDVTVPACCFRHCISRFTVNQCCRRVCRRSCEDEPSLQLHNRPDCPVQVCLPCPGSSCD